MLLSNKPFGLMLLLFAIITSCTETSLTPENQFAITTLSSTADYSTMVAFSGSKNSTTGKIYEVLPGDAVINPAMTPTPFSDNITMTEGSFQLEVKDMVDVDSQSSTDEVTLVNIEFTANDGKKI